MMCKDGAQEHFVSVIMSIFVAWNDALGVMQHHHKCLLPKVLTLVVKSSPKVQFALVQKFWKWHGVHSGQQIFTVHLLPNVPSHLKSAKTSWVLHFGWRGVTLSMSDTQEDTLGRMSGKCLNCTHWGHTCNLPCHVCVARASDFVFAGSRIRTFAGSSCTKEAELFPWKEIFLHAPALEASGKFCVRDGNNSLVQHRSKDDCQPGAIGSVCVFTHSAPFFQARWDKHGRWNISIWVVYLFGDVTSGTSPTSTQHTRNSARNNPMTWQWVQFSLEIHDYHNDAIKNKKDVLVTSSNH